MFGEITTYNSLHADMVCRLFWVVTAANFDGGQGVPDDLRGYARRECKICFRCDTYIKRHRPVKSSAFLFLLDYMEIFEIGVAAFLDC